MTGSDRDAWKETTSGRERVRTVVETLDEPATVTEIADRAAVAWATADSELDRLVAENQVRAHEVDGQTTYGPDPVRQFFDQILALVEDHDRTELEAQLLEYQSRLESLQDDHDARSASEFRQQLTDDRSADEMREIRNVAATWEALETERRIRKQALNVYDDVSRLSESGDGRSGARA